MIVQKDRNRFWLNVEKKGEKDCWEWTASKLPNGYGQFKFGGKHCGAHRFSWMLHNTRTIPTGMYVCHHCDNKACVNPSHLFLGTPSDNVLDSVKKGRWIKNRGEAQWRSKLTQKEVLEIRYKYKNKVANQRELGLEYGVIQQAIQRIVTRNTWKHI